MFSPFVKLGNIQTSLIADPLEEKNAVNVLTLTWKAFVDISNIDEIDFLKIDIEGGSEVITTLEDYQSLHRPIVHLSIHPMRLDLRVRQEQMHRQLDVMIVYGKCLTTDLKPIDIRDLCTDEHAMNAAGMLMCLWIDRLSASDKPSCSYSQDHIMNLEDIAARSYSDPQPVGVI